MESEKTFKSERDPGSESLKLFFENQVLPYLSETDREFIETLQDLEYSKEELRNDYEKILQYDPSNDRGKDFFISVLMPFYMITSSENASIFNDIKEHFLEKTKTLGEILYRDAFFRNSYESFEAWQSCASFKDYQMLLENLNLLPDGAQERIARMSEELDALWSQLEIERAFANSIADGYVDSGVGEGSMLVKMFREDSDPIAKAEYDGYHDMRPDLFPEKYEEYLKELEEPRHPYTLKL